jgi:protein arginine N-methyltransferase 1
MGRRRNKNQTNEEEEKINNNTNNMDNNNSNHLRFQDADEVIEDAGETSNLDQSMGGCDLDDSNDKTSADYYFDSYSHFGNFNKVTIFFIFPNY